MWLALLTYLGGPRLHGWLHRLMPDVQDWIVCRLPWRQKRMQRDFSTMLAVLLDAEVPEAEAGTLAAQATGNVILAQRAGKVRGLLTEGVKLPDAIRVLGGVEVAVMLRQADDEVRGNLRAKSGFDVGSVARRFEGGGHKAASGFTFNGTIDALLPQLLALLPGGDAA